MKFQAKNLLIAGIIAVSQIVGVACAARNVTPSKVTAEKSVTMQKINQISLNITAKVIYTQGSATTLTMSGPDNLLPLIVLDNSNGALSISYPSDLNIKGRLDKDDIVINITSPSVSGFAVCSAGEIEVPSAISVKDLSLAVTGAGDMELKGVTATGALNAAVTGAGDLELDMHVKAAFVNLAVTGAGDLECENITTPLLNAAVSGSGDIELKGGKADVANFSTSGAGDINARKMPAAQVSATVCGAGDILCNATTTLNASITGGGEIKYVGSPKVQCTTARKPFAIGL